jgi:hypothetical protein
MRTLFIFMGAALSYMLLNKLAYQYSTVEHLFTLGWVSGIMIAFFFQYLIRDK